MTVPSATAQIGVTGLAVMGSNIARNFARNGYTVAVHNRSIAKTDALLAEHGGDGDFVRTETMAEFAAALERPRRALIMVQAGDATDAVIEEIAAVFSRATSSSTAATRSTPTPSVVRPAWPTAACCSSVPVSPVAGRRAARTVDHARRSGRRMRPSARCWRRSPRRSTASRAAPTSAPMAAATSSRWSINGIEYADMQLIGEAC